MADIVALRKGRDLVSLLLDDDIGCCHECLCGEAAAEIERLRIGQAVIAKQVGFYKPETPDFEFVRVPLGILRRALHCVPPPYPEDGGAALSIHKRESEPIARLAPYLLPLLAAVPVAIAVLALIYGGAE